MTTNGNALDAAALERLRTLVLRWGSYHASISVLIDRDNTMRYVMQVNTSPMRNMDSDEADMLNAIFDADLPALLDLAERGLACTEVHDDLSWTHNDGDGADTGEGGGSDE